MDHKIKNKIDVGRCDFCGALYQDLVAVLKADPDQRVCSICHEDNRIPTISLDEK